MQSWDYFICSLHSLKDRVWNVSLQQKKVSDACTHLDNRYFIWILGIFYCNKCNNKKYFLRTTKISVNNFEFVVIKKQIKFIFFRCLKPLIQGIVLLMTDEWNQRNLNLKLLFFTTIFFKLIKWHKINKVFHCCIIY